MTNTERAFVNQSRSLLTAEYLPKIGACVAGLPDEDIWWRPNPTSNSIGHLLLHLSGNLQEWVVSALGGHQEQRQRHLEFAPDREPSIAELMERLARTVSEADAVLGTLDGSILAERRLIQGESVTALEAIYHAVEHFSMHTGQVIYIAKLRTGRDLAFYEVKNGIARPQRTG